MSAQEQETQRILFSGRVQGVGFRWTTRRLATGHNVNGFVRNLADGRVELVVQGAPPIVEAFLTELQRQFEGYVTHTECEHLDSPPVFTSFDIRA